MRFLLAVIFIVSIFQISFAQDNATTGDNSQRKSRKLDLPGAFVFDIGFNRLDNPHNSLKQKFFYSRGINVNYQYNIKLIGEKFSFMPGIGVGNDNYTLRFSNTLELGPDTTSLSPLTVEDTLGIVPLTYQRTVKTKFTTTYLDIPLEFHFKTKTSNNTAFKFTIGAKVGFLLTSHTKVKFKEEGDLQKIKEKNMLPFRPVRYGLTARVGYSNFHLFGYYSLTELFEDGKGIKGTAMAPYMVGITISTF